MASSLLGVNNRRRSAHPRPSARRSRAAASRPRRAAGVVARSPGGSTSKAQISFGRPSRRRRAERRREARSAVAVSRSAVARDDDGRRVRRSRTPRRRSSRVVGSAPPSLAAPPRLVFFGARAREAPARRDFARADGQGHRARRRRALRGRRRTAARAANVAASATASSMLFAQCSLSLFRGANALRRRPSGGAATEGRSRAVHRDASREQHGAPQQLVEEKRPFKVSTITATLLAPRFDRSRCAALDRVLRGRRGSSSCRRRRSTRRAGSGGANPATSKDAGRSPVAPPPKICSACSDASVNAQCQLLRPCVIRSG